MNDETPAIETPEALAAAAYDQAKAGFEIFGLPLYAYSPTRIIAAQRMGLMWGRIMEDHINAIGYSGEMDDIITVLWLCTIPCKSEMQPGWYSEGRWYVERARARQDEARTVADEWGASHKLTDPNSDEYQRAKEVFLAIVRGDMATAFAVTTDARRKPPEGQDKGNA